MSKLLALLAFLVFPSCAHALSRAHLSAASQTQILRISAHSLCATHKWKGRGEAPAGFIQGMAVSFAQSLCQANPLLTAAVGNPKKDSLAHYQERLSSLGFRLDQPGANSIRALFLLGYGEGMRESSGNYCEGWDESAGANRPAEAGEAGLFQTSLDSLEASNKLIALYNDYRNHPQDCLLAEYKLGASCRPQNVLGNGAGAEYQTFTRNCPAFSVDSAMILMRILRQHFGPIDRREVELSPACDRMLSEVQTLIEANHSTACIFAP